MRLAQTTAVLLSAALILAELLGASPATSNPSGANDDHRCGQRANATRAALAQFHYAVGGAEQSGAEKPGVWANYANLF